MKHIIKEQSIAAFFRDALLYPSKSDSASPRDGGYYLTDRSSSSYEIVREILIRQDQGIDVGDVVVFEFNEYTNITRKESNVKQKFNCTEYDSVSFKLIKE